MPTPLPPVEWPACLDPSEVKDYAHDFQAELSGTSDTLSTSTFILPSDAIAAGLEIDRQSATTYGGIVWLKVNVSNQASAMWDGAGTTFRIRHQITTAAGRTLERSILLTVAQQ